MVFINQEPRYSRTDGERGFVFWDQGKHKLMDS
jgi:hypothetical protein